LSVKRRCGETPAPFSFWWLLTFC